MSVTQINRPRPFVVGKRQALIPLDSPSRAKCIGLDCQRDEAACPRHEARAYRVDAKHYREPDVIVVSAPTLAEGLDRLRAELAPHVGRTS
ncbi:hypothetical protein F9L07_22790 [Pimelobacter simplex]|uniref:Uncharacterized protein n=1 Tax=Nocardioides simplex TaxID=2045 RepID=A0A7J5DTA9_NOCSI|nr:hypothetical protein [Pimelobacter simplex]KAB2808346.1 hypothetical protein F9L07_22790 [Pimelobacter simplex]